MFTTKIKAAALVSLFVTLLLISGCAGSPSSNAPYLSTVTLTPVTVTIDTTETQAYVATGADQFGNAYNISPTYSASGSGSMNGNVFVPSTTGDATITATAEGKYGHGHVTVVPALASITLTVGKAALAIGDTTTLVAAGLDQYGHPYTITPKFSTTGNAVSLNGITVTGTKVGSSTITASQGKITSNGVSVSVGLDPQTVTFSAPGSQPAGTTETLSATASSGLPVIFSSSTPAVCTVSGTTASLIAGGTCMITASQAGNSQYGAASTPQSFNVTFLTQNITFSALLTHNVGDSYVLSATASSGLPVTITSLTPTICSTTAALGPGQCQLQASQAGNPVYAAAASVTQSFTILTPQTIAFSAAPTGVQLGGSFTVTATATSDLPVTLTSLTPTVCSTTTALTTGTCTIQATQTGNSTFAPASLVNQSFSIGLDSQTITFPAPTPAKTFTVSATSSSGLPVTFSTTSTSCMVVGNTVTEILSGDCLIEADQAGNSTYAAAAPATQDVTIGQSVALVSVSPSSTTLAPGATQQFTATATDQFNQPMLIVPTFVWATGSGAGVDQTGLYTAFNSGDTTLSDTVTASVGAVTSNTAAVTLSPAAPILTIVNLSPQTPTINAPNGTANFSTTANDQFGRPYVPAPVCTYLSSNLSAATIGANGQAVATNTSTIVQTTTITAVCGSFTEMTLLTVNPPPYIKTLTVAPVTVTAYSATTAPVTATDEYGNPFPISAGQITLGSFNSTYVSVAISSSPTAALSIGGNAAIASTPVTITVGSVSTTFNVTVTACLPSVCYTPVVTSIAVNAQDGTLDPMEFNGTQVLVASALDQHGANFSTTFTWTSNSSYLTVDVNGNVTAVGIGSGTISASAGGVTGTSAIIVITDAPYPSTPIITSLYPPMAVAKTYASSSQAGVQPHSTAIVVNGTGFLPGAVVCFGSDCGASYTTFKSSTKLVMLVPWQDLTTAGTVNVTVQDPALVGYTDQSSTVGEASAPSTFTLTTKGFVTITFDDGFSSGLTGTALFNAQGIKTTQFIITGNTCATIGTCASNGLRSDGYPWGWNGVGPDTGCPYASYKLPVTAAQISACSVGVGETGYISWANVATLAASGNEIAPHTRSHDEISYESAADVTGELAGALADLQYHAAPGHDTVAGYPITSVLAYPYGDYGCYASDPAFNSCVTGRLSDEAVGTQVKAAGYRGARTSDAALEGGLKFMESVPNGDDCSNDSCWSWGDQPLFLHTITADQTTGDTCSFAGGTSCDTSASNGAAPCMENGVKVTKPGFKCWVDNAVQTGTWVVLLFHRVDDNTGSDKGLSVNSTEIQSLALYLKAQGIATVTFRQGLAMEGIDGQYETVDSSGNIVSYPSPID